MPTTFSRPSIARRIARPAAACLAAAALAALAAGCGGDDKPMNTNSAAVHTTDTHTVSDSSTSSFDTTQYFPQRAEGRRDRHGRDDGAQDAPPEQGRPVHDQGDEPDRHATVKNVMISSTNPDGFQVTGVSGGPTTQPMDKGMGYAVGDLGPNETKTFMVNGMATKVGIDRHLLLGHVRPAHAVHDGHGD